MTFCNKIVCAHTEMASIKRRRAIKALAPLAVTGNVWAARRIRILVEMEQELGTI
tara:strand:+ start:278 stop:442 length:165 start_codon:yes stop_codon:yes gene_type:complete